MPLFKNKIERINNHGVRMNSNRMTGDFTSKQDKNIENMKFLAKNSEIKVQLKS